MKPRQKKKENGTVDVTISLREDVIKDIEFLCQTTWFLAENGTRKEDIISMGAEMAICKYAGLAQNELIHEMLDTECLEDKRELAGQLGISTQILRRRTMCNH